jgi:DNA-binding NtrC family response regulator
MVGESEPMQRVYNLVEGCDVTVLLTGKAGTGKEFISRAIHHKSPEPTVRFSS